MVKGKDKPHYIMPEITIIPDASINNVHTTLCGAIDCFLSNHPKTIMALSGGWDSRILACISSELGYDIPAYTTYNHLESRMAKKVCKALNMSRHYFFEIQYEITEEDYNRIEKVCIDSLGTTAFWAIFEQIRVVERLSDLGIYGNTTHIMHGGRFNELLQGVDLYSMLSAINFGREINCPWLPRLCLPYLNTDVISSIFSLPEDVRRNKHFQFMFLLEVFPELAKIPSTNTYNRLLVNRVDRFLKLFGRPRLFHQLDVNRLLRVNREFLLRKLRRYEEWDDEIPVGKAISMMKQNKIVDEKHIMMTLICGILLDHGDTV